jgi:AmmeMemoRadiSam system protein A
MNKSDLPKIARDVITNVLDREHQLDISTLNSELGEQATFVTLTKNGQLRGCIGTIVPHRTLSDDLVHNARAAAFNDPRFPPLSKEELNDIEIEVSLLTPPTHVTYENIDQLKTIIRPHIDGIIMKLGNQQATFLPQVWEQLPTFESFFAALGRKAGVGENMIEHQPTIYRYQVEAIEEHQ